MSLASTERNAEEWQNESNWHCFHFFYASARDSRLFVPSHPKRWPRTDPPFSNTTPNLGNGRVYLPLALIAVPILLLGIVAVLDVQSR